MYLLWVSIIIVLIKVVGFCGLIFCLSWIGRWGIFWGSVVGWFVVFYLYVIRCFWGFLYNSGYLNIINNKLNYLMFN